MILNRDAGDERRKYKVVRRTNYMEIVKDAEVVESSDETGICTLLVTALDEQGHVVMVDGKPKLSEQRYDFSECGGIATIKR